MNIVVLTANNKVVVRPDTTWERLNNDLYLPDYVSSLSFSAVIYARISKPGKNIAPRFASRYYDSVGLGLLFYPENLIDGSVEGYASALCLGHSSYLPVDMISADSWTNPQLKVYADGLCVFNDGGYSIDLINNTLSSTSETCLIKIGDLVCRELGQRIILPNKELSICIESSWSEKAEFKIY